MPTVGSFSVDDLIKNTRGSRYKLAILVARRAIELSSGSPKLIEGSPGNSLSIAIQEVKEGKVRLKEEEPQ